jgi:hypothetical protein
VKLVVLLILVLLFPCVILAQDNLSQEDAQKLLRKIERVENLQTEFPEKPTFEYNFDMPPSDLTLPATIIKIILWGGIAVIVLLVVYNIFKNVRHRPKAEPDISDKTKNADADTAPIVARMQKAQIAADELASLGRFAEAMHTLLLQSLEELKRRINKPIASSLTSREILFSSDLPGSGYFAFSDIVLRVEKCYFGTHEPVEADYLACRESYEAFTAILRGN